MEKIYLFLIVGFLLTSCLDGGPRSYSKYQLYNSSDYDIRIETYSRKTDGLHLKFNLKSGEGIWESSSFETTRGRSVHLEDAGALDGDSILVFFNDQRFTIHTPANLFDRSLMDHRNFQRLIISENETIDRYPFTNDDYENATPIGQ
jgi:hypothetical protein